MSGVRQRATVTKGISSLNWQKTQTFIYDWGNQYTWLKRCSRHPCSLSCLSKGICISHGNSSPGKQNKSSNFLLVIVLNFNIVTTFKKYDSYLSPSHHCPGMNCCSGRWCMTALSPGCCYTHCRTQVQMFFSSCDEKDACRDWFKIWYLLIHKNALNRSESIILNQTNIEFSNYSKLKKKYKSNEKLHWNDQFPRLSVWSVHAHLMMKFTDIQQQQI